MLYVSLLHYRGPVAQLRVFGEGCQCRSRVTFLNFSQLMGTSQCLDLTCSQEKHQPSEIFYLAEHSSPGSELSWWTREAKNMYFLVGIQLYDPVGQLADWPPTSKNINRPGGHGKDLQPRRMTCQKVHSGLYFILFILLITNKQHHKNSLTSVSWHT